MTYELLFLKALSMTIAIETPVLIVFIRLIIRQKDVGITRLLITGFIASFATLPYLWFIFPNFIHPKMLYIIACESFAVLIESIIIYATLRTRIFISILASFVCNMISFLTGLLIM